MYPIAIVNILNECAIDNDIVISYGIFCLCNTLQTVFK